MIERGLDGKRRLLLFYWSAAAFFLSAASLMLVPLASFEKGAGQRTIAYLIGAGFWLGLITALVLQGILTRDRKQHKKEEKKSAIRFCTNPPARVFDILSLLGLIGFILVLLLRDINEWLAAAIISGFLFTFEMRCLFNGKNFNC